MKKFLLFLTVSVYTFSLIAQVRVKGHYRNGTYVRPHYRSSPNGTVTDNYSYKGNVNPYTGEVGTRTYEQNGRKYRISGCFTEILTFTNLKKAAMFVNKHGFLFQKK